MKKRFLRLVTTVVIFSMLTMLTMVTSAANVLTISGQNYPPSQLNVGQSFSIKGIINSNTNITKVTVNVFNSSGTVETGKSAEPNTKSYDISKLDKYIYFDKLTAGTKTYKVFAKNSSGVTTLVNKTFTVVKAASSGSFVRPLTKNWRITQAFSSSHNGIDLGAVKAGVAGDPVVAAINGTVVRAEKSASYGYVVYINSVYNGTYIQTRYAHLNSMPSVRTGATVKAGTLIGYMGNTGQSEGVHLHFEVRLSPNGKPCSTANDSIAVNPSKYIN